MNSTMSSWFVLSFPHLWQLKGGTLQRVEHAHPESLPNHRKLTVNCLNCIGTNHWLSAPLTWFLRARRHWGRVQQCFGDLVKCGPLQRQTWNMPFLVSAFQSHQQFDFMAAFCVTKSLVIFNLCQDLYLLYQIYVQWEAHTRDLQNTSRQCRLFLLWFPGLIYLLAHKNNLNWDQECSLPMLS